MCFRSHEVTLVDTLGFDDSERVDTDTLLELAEWLGLQGQKEIKFTGLIYLHRITGNRPGPSAVENPRLMRALVGENNMRNVVLVTNRWEEIAVSIVNTLLYYCSYSPL